MKPSSRSRLLQSEIDASPKAAPSAQPNMDGRIAQNAGVAVLDLVNSSGVENNFWVWIVPDRREDAWLARRCRVRAYGPVTGIQDATDGDKLKVYAAQGTSRRMVIEVELPKQAAESRAGVYRMSAMVSCQAPLKIDGKDEHNFKYPFRIAVRPIPLWSLEADPPETEVRLFRRRRVLWIRVVNRGNDWLYVDLKLPKNTAPLVFDRLAERVAVAPATKDGPTVRRVPLRVRSRHKGLRGAEVRTPIPLSATRVDAPSLARFPSDSSPIVPSLNLSDAVVAEGTTETQTVSGAEVVYRPPIPSSIPEFFERVRANLARIFFYFVGLIGLGFTTMWAYEHLVHPYSSAAASIWEAGTGHTSTKTDLVKPGGTLILRGPHLDGSDIEVKIGEGSPTVDPKDITFGRDGQDVQIEIKLPATGYPVPLNPTKATVFVIRKGFGRSFLSSPIFGKFERSFTIGPEEKPEPYKPPPKPLLAPTFRTRGTVKLGKEFTLVGTNATDFGDKPGKVFLGDLPLEIVRWTKTEIVVKMTDNTDFVGTQPISIHLQNGAPEGEKDILVVAEPLPDAPPPKDGESTTGEKTGEVPPPSPGTTPPP